MDIPGHNLILPDTMKNMKHTRIVLVVRNNLTVHKLEEHMDEPAATIWVRVGQ